MQLEATSTRQRAPDPAIPQQSQQVDVALVAFELDLFGRMRKLSEAALNEYLASDEAAESARISLVAEVISTFLARAGAQQRHRFSSRMLAAREASLRLLSQRRERGVASALDYHEAAGLVQQARADLQRIDRELRQTGNALALLVGTPGAVANLPASTEDMTLLVQSIAPGTPSELLARRPDIRAAEHRLRSRNASVGAARAAFFPRISLTGSSGGSSTDLADLFDAGQRTWSFSPQITLPIFDAGANRANLDLAHARSHIAVAAYEQAVQNAFLEVSQALVALETLRREESARREMAHTSAEAVRLSELRYRSGVDSHLRHLDAQRNDFAHQMALIEVQTQHQIALATLFRALGGNWSPADLRQHGIAGSAAVVGSGGSWP